MEREVKFMLMILAFIGLMILIYLTKKYINRFIKKKGIEIHRRKIILQVFFFSYYILFAFAVILILGISMNDFIIFSSSVLAVIGVSFFAQWSILSNLTAAIILFFNHPVRIGDRIKILNKEFDYTGKVLDITNFYLLIETEEDKKRITIPNTVVLYTGIELLD